MSMCSPISDDWVPVYKHRKLAEFPRKLTFKRDVLLLSPQLCYKKPDHKGLHFPVKGSQRGESARLGPSSASCMNLGKVFMLFVSYSSYLKIIIIVPPLRGYCEV